MSASRWVLRFQGTTVPLPLGRLEIGRGSEVDLRVDLPEVSRRHVALIARTEMLEVEDLGSINGVLVNGVLLERQGPLQAGDRLTLGGVDFEVLLSDEAVLATEEDQTTRRMATHKCAKCGTRVVVALATCPSCGATMPGLDVQVTQPMLSVPPLDQPEADPTERTLTVIFTRVDRSLARGRAVEANALAHAPFSDALTRLQAGGALDPRLVRGMHQRALRLASALWSAKWCVFALDIYSAVAEVPGDHAIDRIEELLPGNERALQPALTALLALLGGTAPADLEARLARLKALTETCGFLLAP